MDGIIAYILSKKYTNDTVIGMGAIKGAACQVQSINKVNKTTTITLEWEDNVGTSHTQSFDIEDGLDGVSVTGATIKPDGHLELTLSNGNSIDCGQVLPQYDTMPTPSASNEGQILQYIGTTTSSYTNGYFYQCINDGGIYKWSEKSVQDSYTKGQIGSLSDLPDTSKNVIENIADIKLSVNQLSASKLSISDIDNALSDESENPVQNKVIKLTLDQLRGSILTLLNDKEDRFRYSIMPTASVDYLNKIVEYIGTTDITYTNGYFYQCRFDGTNYEWIQKNVQPSGGSGGGDGVVDGYYNSTDQLFYEDSSFLNPITGEDNTIYVDLNTNGLYRYNGVIFIKVSSSAESIQVDTMPTADSTQLNKIYQYIGVTDINYTNGYFYKCIFDGANYKWQVIPTQDSYTKAEIGALSDLPDPSKTVTQNIDLLQGSMLTLQGSVLNIKNDVTNLQGSVLNIQTDVSALQGSMAGIDKTKLDNLAPIYLIGSGLTLDTTVGSPTYGKLQATGMSIPVDDHLDASSLNPVQNKVITLTIDQLQGSVLNKIQKMLGAQEDNFAIIDNDGGVKDSGISKDVVPLSASASNKLLVASDLSVKADKVSGATNDDIALLDGTGNLKDSNKKLSDYQEKLTDGNGVVIDASNNIGLDISYLTASRVGYIPATEKGSNNGVAELDNAGKVPSSQLPSYVDDVIEGYLDSGTFYEDSAHTIPITPESGKIYVDLTTNTTYRWGGSAYVQISESLALGETSTTAYRGDRGKTAYDHSQITDGSNPHNTTANNINLNVPIPALSGSKLDVESTLYGINTALGTKADKVSSATNGDLAGLDSNGNLTDSGVVASKVIQKVTTATGLLKDDGTVDTTDYQPINLSAPIDTLGGTMLTVESTLNEFNTEIKGIDTDLDGKLSYVDNGILGAKNLNRGDVTHTYIRGTGSSAPNRTYRCPFALLLSINDKYTVSFDITSSSDFDVANAGISMRFEANGNTSASEDWGAGHTVGHYEHTFTITQASSTLSELYLYLDQTETNANATLIVDNLMIRLADDTDNTYQPPAMTNVELTQTVSSVPIIAPTPSGSLTENTIVDTVNSAINTNNNAPSLFTVQKYSNEKKVRRVLNGANIPSGTSMTATGIGTWTDKAIDQITSSDETDWWYDAAFIVPVYYMLTSDTSIVTGKTYYTRSGSGTEQDPYVYTAVANPSAGSLSTYYEQYSDDVDISIKFDPSGDTATLGGYIFDSTTGKICIKFGNSITVNTARIAVDITYTRNEVG